MEKDIIEDMKDILKRLYENLYIYGEEKAQEIFDKDTKELERKYLKGDNQ